MSLTLMYITNNPEVAVIAQKAGVDRVWVDMEYIDKDLRQGGMDTVQSHHTIDDIKKLRPVVTDAQLQVRINHMYDGSEDEINQTIEAGADIIMLPYFKTRKEVEDFIKFVDGRAKTIILVETAEAYENIDDILEVPGIDEVHIGLNDLHLAYGKDFMFELLIDGTVPALCEKLRKKGIKFGFGGIARVGYGTLPAENIITEHYALGSQMAILSRGFCDANKVENPKDIEEIFIKGVKDIRAKEKEVSLYTQEQYAENHKFVEEKIGDIVTSIRKKKEEKKMEYEKIWLATPTMHGDELKYVTEAYETNWMSTVGANINEVERLVAEKVGCKYAVALSCGTASLHMCVKLAGVKPGDKVFCSDMTFDATVNPVVYEGGVPVFIDTEYDTWNMDTVALRKAFELYPDVKVVVVANLYGTPGKLDEIRAICDEHNAVLIEDTAESFGATYKGVQTGSFGDYNAISFNGNKIITGSSGGMFLTDDLEAANKVRKWSTQSRENAPWYQHEELGYNYRMSNVIAGVVRGQMKYLDEHIEQKKAIYYRYKEAFKDLPVSMNPFDEETTAPNYWLSCMIIDEDAMCKQVRSETEALYVKEKGKTCPTEILEKLAEKNIEGRPIWKPMHMQPIYRMNGFVTRDGNGRARTNAYIAGGCDDIGMDIFNRGLCLPSDNKMTEAQQNRVIEIIRSCFED